MITSVNAANAYATARRAVGPSEGGPDLGAVAQSFVEVMSKGDQTAVGAMTGTTPTQDLVTQLSETKLAMEAVVSIRDKVVEAYQEILRMPV